MTKPYIFGQLPQVRSCRNAKWNTVTSDIYELACDSNGQYETRKIDSWYIFGTHWFQPTYGNTYHVVRIYKNGELVHTSPMQYGYGDQYLQTAIEWMTANGAPAKSDNDYHNTIYLHETLFAEYQVSDVKRKKDL